jgi:ABC-2 type transport system ATP-binding protein
MASAGGVGPAAATPVAVEVRDLHKSFRIPIQRIDSLKERAMHPMAGREFRELQALNGVSFDIHKGEFFGIVGRNGSGKSTLLKLLASIYRADSGKIRIAGRVAPFIELGVGFNQDLTARENVVLNGVMMGLRPREVRQRIDAVIDFAELHEFADLKLKNYSSGMLVRLAFSMMLEADADILLIDEVLAVGDAAFQQKCADAFHSLKAAGKTLVLVTHEMAAVETYCHRAMLIDGGRIARIGDPAEVGRHYLQLNFERHGEEGGAKVEEGAEVKVVNVHLENADGEPTTSVEHGDPIRLRMTLEAKQDLAGLDIGYIISNADGVGVAHFGTPVGEGDDRAIAAGERVHVEIELDNPLTPGRYFIHCGINRAFAGGIALYVHNALDFVVFGGPDQRGVVVIEHRSRTEIERGGR